jgi:hypothetical protein
MVNNALELKGLALLAAFIACAPDRFATVYSARQRRAGTPSLNRGENAKVARAAKAQFDEATELVDRPDARLGRIRDAA